MPQIVRAEFLSYYNSRKNSDKVFNIFLVEDDDGSFRCVSEHGRRGSKLVRITLISNATRATAEGNLQQKLLAKRNHRETPYISDPFGQSNSQLAREYEFNLSARSDVGNSNRTNQSSPALFAIPKRQNVIEFPGDKAEKKRQIPKQTGILNQEQFDSLEI